MEKKFSVTDRLIVAADFKPAELRLARRWVFNEVNKLAKELRKTGVTIKVNSALRACGYDLIDIIHSHDLKVMADLKLADIASTLETDGALLKEAAPEILTVYCATGPKAITALRSVLTETDILGVTVLTDFDEVDADEIYGNSLVDSVKRLAETGIEAGVDGIVSSAAEAKLLREIHGDAITLNTPAIRPLWSVVKDDNQNPDRIMTPVHALRAGADRIIVGRPILFAKNPYDAVMYTLEEIKFALE